MDVWLGGEKTITGGFKNKKDLSKTSKNVYLKRTAWWWGRGGEYTDRTFYMEMNEIKMLVMKEKKKFNIRETYYVNYLLKNRQWLHLIESGCVGIQREIDNGIQFYLNNISFMLFIWSGDHHQRPY